MSAHTHYTNCCALDHISCDSYATQEEIIKAMKATIRSANRTTYFVVARTDEIRLMDTLNKMGFIEVAEFNRRAQYVQSIKLKMFMIEPQFVTDKPKANEVVVKRPVGRPRKDAIPPPLPVPKERIVNKIKIPKHSS